MNKLFLAICFNIVLGLTFSAEARIVEINQIDQLPEQKPIELTPPDNLPDPADTQSVIEFFRKRFQTASVTKAEDAEDLNKPDSMDIQHSAEYIKQMKEESKSTFEKIYDQAMGRISDPSREDVLSGETVFYEQVKTANKEAESFKAPNIPVVDVILPGGHKILAPAREHIPYILASFNILPTGLIQVQEDITVVANGQKLKNGLTKILPKFSTSRAGVRKKLDIDLLSVEINGKKIPYILEEIGDKIYIKPQNAYILSPGVYTYTFKYLLDRKLWYYDDFTEFYWDVSGSYWNLVISSANAIVSVPEGRHFISQNSFVGFPKRLSTSRALVASLDENALGFASTTPLLPGEGMHLLVSLDENVFVQPGLSRRFVWFVTDYGDVLFSLAGLAAILISYMLSWKYIRQNRSKMKVTFKRTAAALRCLRQGSFDKKAFVAALLDLCRQDIIDIQSHDNDVLIIKKTDNLNRLTRGEKKAVNQLFSGKDSVISAVPANLLKFNRAATALEKQTKLSLKLLSLQLNITYLFFSIGMLILVEIAIAMLGINPLQTAMVLFSTTLMIAFYIWMMKRPFRSKLTGYIVKSVAAVLIVLAILLMSIYIKLISALLLAAMVYVIFEYSELFSRRNGLLKQKIKESDDLCHYLKTNAGNIAKTQEFVIQQPNIFACDLQSFYPQNEYNHANYRLEEAQHLLDKLN